MRISILKVGATTSRGVFFVFPFGFIAMFIVGCFLSLIVTFFYVTIMAGGFGGNKKDIDDEKGGDLNNPTVLDKLKRKREGV